MIPKALSLVAVCNALAFAATPAFADDARSAPGVQAVSTWTAPPSAAPLSLDATAGASGDDTPDDFDLLTIPEPATLAMFGAGLLGLLGVGYRRRRR